MSQKLAKAKKISIYDYDQRIQRTFNLIKNELPEETTQLINDYHNSMISQSMADATRHKHLQTLLSLSRFLGKNWNDVTKRDIDLLVAKIVQTYSEDGQETHTTHDHKKILKIFFRWFKLGSRNKDDVGDPPETKDVKLKRVKDKIVREDLITEADKTKLLAACGENARDRAFLDVHYEAGTRPGEILNLQIKHVKFDDNGAVIHVDGKTGARPIRLIKSVPNLASWMSVHPFKENPNAPLWPLLTPSKYGQPLSYHATGQMLKRRIEMAKILKHVHLNLFRHSEATETAKFLTEAQMKKRHGWTPESKMPARYVHLVNADVDNAIFEHYGMKKNDKEIPNLPKKCKFCEVPNSPEAARCSKCGKPLDLKTALEMEEEDRREKDELKQMLQEIKIDLEKVKKRQETAEKYEHLDVVTTNVK